MSVSPIVVIIPAVTIRGECPALKDFGISREKNIAKLSANGAFYDTASVGTNEILLVNERLLDKYDSQLKKMLTSVSPLQVVIHAGALQPEMADDLRASGVRAVFHPFHHTRTDAIFPSLLALLASFSTRSPSDAATFQNLYHHLADCLRTDHQLERRLDNFHQSVKLPRGFALSKGAIVVCHEGALAGQFRKLCSSSLVVTTPKALDAAVKPGAKLLILAELLDEGNGYTRFQGYETARMLLARHDRLHLAFMSFLPREKLRTMTQASRMLVPIFPHFQIPNDFALDEGALKIPEVSATKSTIIRNYYLRPDGMIDKLLHDLKKLSHISGKQRMTDTLDLVLANAPILTDEILTSAKRVRAAVEKDVSGALQKLRALQHLLEEYYAEMVKDESVKIGKRAPYRIIIVEDDRETLSALMSGFQAYFSEVCGFTDGEEALKTICKNPRGVSALFVDMELLNEDGFWQPLQGCDLIESVKDFPHLVICMLTVFSRRALSSVQNVLTAGKIGYIPKDPILGLPPDMGYAAFAAQLQKQIQEQRKLLEGPRQGVWKKGLLNFYYKKLTAQNRADLWCGAIADVERFLALEQSNEQDAIPRQLFNVGTKDFRRQHLETVLRHRLICLFRQYQEGEIVFERGIKKSIGFTLSNPKHYFTTILGFSISFKKDEKDCHVCIIHKQGIFAREIEWLKAKFPVHDATNFPKLIETLQDAAGYAPPLDRRENAVFSHDLATLDDCLQLLQALASLPEKAKEDVAVDLDWYRENETREFGALKKHSAGSGIVDLILNWTNLQAVAEQAVGVHHPR